MFKIYILKSQKLGKYYTGHTGNLAERLKAHNGGRVRSTKNGIPWKIAYSESCETKSEAYKRELDIKSYKSGLKFKELLKLNF